MTHTRVWRREIFPTGRRREKNLLLFRLSAHLSAAIAGAIYIWEEGKFLCSQEESG